MILSGDVNIGSKGKEELPRNSRVADKLKQHLKGFRIKEAIFECEAMEILHTGEDIMKGSWLRDGLAHNLVRVCCTSGGMGRRKFCLGSSCEKAGNCPYYWGFVFNKRPMFYMLKPTFDGKGTYQRGEVFSFSLVLVGDALSYLYQFTKAFEAFGMTNKRSRLNRESGGFAVNHVREEHSREATEFFRKSEGSACSHILRFLSPYVPNRQKKQTYETGGQDGFPVFLDNLVHRILNLRNIYFNNKGYQREKIRPGVDLRIGMLRSIAEGIVCRPQLVRARQRNCYSASEETWYQIRGFLGQFELDGDLSPLMPYLRIGEIIGAGSNTTIGFGRYEIVKR